MTKITILTQALLNNYGGILQNFALQQTLIKMGCNVETIDYQRTINFTPLWRYVLSLCKSFLFTFIPGNNRKITMRTYKGHRAKWIDNFVKKNIKLSNKCYNYKSWMLQDSDIIIVGSDQVWRPKYNHKIEDMFFKFAERMPIKKIAYAASFGVDVWEYTPMQTKTCSALAKKFDAISVREESGVKLCREHLGVDATWVLDPTLLLSKEDYCEVCKEVPVAKERFLAAYVLDKNDEISAQCKSIAKELGIVLKFFEANSSATLTIPEWLSMFRDASYVVTDSFHGTVFSIIFAKEFKCLYNKSRGSARFDSLLKMYESGKLNEMREFSLNWLKKALEK